MALRGQRPLVPYAVMLNTAAVSLKVHLVRMHAITISAATFSAEQFPFL
jgi:hypothetical protein